MNHADQPGIVPKSKIFGTLTGSWIVDLLELYRAALVFRISEYVREAEGDAVAKNVHRNVQIADGNRFSEYGESCGDATWDKCGFG